jgi:sulfoxide reductase catalytic subunit YedY
VTGAVKTPLNLTYKELRQLPVIERGVLLICPGFFAYKGRWRGISIRGLLEAAQTTESEVTHLTLSGPAGSYEKVERFSISELENDKLFLAYAVNGDNLPREHGFPLRLVAEDHFGSRWVKYVEKIEFQATN